jgi:TolB-like protein
VLPFVNFGGGPDQEYFVDGITESLTTDISRIPGILVIARNTAFSYRGATIDARQIGRELGVRYVMEGSVQSGADRIRVNAQLIDAETGAHIWAERFDKTRKDLFDMQDEIPASPAWWTSSSLPRKAFAPSATAQTRWIRSIWPCADGPSITGSCRPLACASPGPSSKRPYVSTMKMFPR